MSIVKKNTSEASEESEATKAEQDTRAEEGKGYTGGLDRAHGGGLNTGDVKMSATGVVGQKAEDRKAEGQEQEAEKSPAEKAEEARRQLTLEHHEADQKRFQELLEEGKNEAEASVILAKEQRERAEKEIDSDGNRVSKTRGVLTGSLAEEARASDEERESVQAVEEQREKAKADAERDSEESEDDDGPRAA